jgi:phospholipid transport system substrate-binding protein
MHSRAELGNPASIDPAPVVRVKWAAMHPTSVCKLRAIGAMITVLILTAGPVGATASSPPDPMGAVRLGVDQVLTVFRDRDVPLQARREKLRQLAEQHFDFADMARSALGYHWRDLSPAQRASFVPLFSTFIQDAYLSKLQEYTVRKVQDEAKTAKITFSRETFDGADYAEVFSDVLLIDQKDPLQVNYLMHRRDGVWLIYDITLDAISVIANYRNQFNRVINNDGYAKLVADLRTKAAQLEEQMDHPSTEAADAK